MNEVEHPIGTTMQAYYRFGSHWPPLLEVTGSPYQSPPWPTLTGTITLLYFSNQDRIIKKSWMGRVSWWY